MKMIKAFIVFLVLVGQVIPVVAVAEDRLTLSGEMRVRGWHEDLDLGDRDDSDSTWTWADQRLRIAGTLAVAEGVSITFRTDITESDWGSGNSNGSGRTTVCKDVDGDTECSDFQSQHWDRAHIDITKNSFHVRAGQYFTVYGTTKAVDSQSNGISVDYRFGDVPVNAFFQLIDDNDSRNEADAFLSGARIAPMFGDVATSLFVANYNDGLSDSGADGDGAGENVWLIGADLKAMLGPVNFKGEIDFFTGDAGWDSDSGNSLDATGMNIWLDGSLAATDAVTLGAQFFYGAGDDEDVQYTYLGTGFDGWDPLADVGTSLSNEQITYDRPFNMATFSLGAEGQYSADLELGSLGAIGGRLYTGFKATEELSFGASIAYAQEEEDALAELDTLLLAAGMVYRILPNTTFEVQLQYADGTLEVENWDGAGNDIDDDFDAFQAGTGLFVKF